MNTNVVQKITEEYTKVKHPKFNVGDIVEVHTKIKEGPSTVQMSEEEDKPRERIQIFKGVVISIKGSGVTKRFTVRKISYGIGVEKIFPLYSPTVAKIKIVKRAEKVKRSKLYYLRKRVGKKALKAGLQVPAVGEDLETKFEEEMKESAEDAVDKSEESEEEKKEEKSEQEEKSEKKKDSKEKGENEKEEKSKKNEKEKPENKKDHKSDKQQDENKKESKKKKDKNDKK